MISWVVFYVALEMASGFHQNYISSKSTQKFASTPRDSETFLPFPQHEYNRNRRGDVPASSYKAILAGGTPSGFGSQAASVGIISQTQKDNFDGTFSYSFIADNGISIDVKGSMKTLSSGEQVQVMQGQYSYTAPDGTPVTTRWYADETGYHAEGTHLPGTKTG